MEQNQTQRRISVRRLLLVETGTYNDPVFRPYQSNLDMTGLRAFQEMAGGEIRVSPTALAGIAGQIIQPVTQPTGRAGIVNGWTERRFRFMMEVETMTGNQFGQSTTIEVVTGFTDHPGAIVSRNAAGNVALDPNMRLYINNIIMVNQATMTDQTGVHNEFRVSDASHVLAPPAAVGMGLNGNDITLMRPMDVFGSMSASRIGGQIQDLRSNFAANSIHKSRRSNNVASEYLARSVNTLAMAEADMRDYEDPDDMMLFSKARKLATEQLISNDQFLTFLETKTSYSQLRSIAYGELLGHFPELDSKTGVSFIAQEVKRSRLPMAQRGDSEVWESCGPETLAAQVLCNSVPSIMLDNMLTRFAFTLTNATLGGQPRLEFTDFDSFSNIDMRPYIQRTIERIIGEVFPDVTHNGAIPVFARMVVDVLGETRVEISYNGGPLTPYTLASFADANFSPIVTNHQGLIGQIATDIRELVGSLNGQRPAALGASSFVMPGQQPAGMQAPPSIGGLGTAPAPIGFNQQPQQPNNLFLGGSNGGFASRPGKPV